MDKKQRSPRQHASSRQRRPFIVHAPTTRRRSCGDIPCRGYRNLRHLSLSNKKTTGKRVPRKCFPSPDSMRVKQKLRETFRRFEEIKAARGFSHHLASKYHQNGKPWKSLDHARLQAALYNEGVEQQTASAAGLAESDYDEVEETAAAAEKKLPPTASAPSPKNSERAQVDPEQKFSVPIVASEEEHSDAILFDLQEPGSGIRLLHKVVTESCRHRRNKQRRRFGAECTAGEAENDEDEKNEAPQTTTTTATKAATAAAQTTAQTTTSNNEAPAQAGTVRVEPAAESPPTSPSCCERQDATSPEPGSELDMTGIASDSSEMEDEDDDDEDDEDLDDGDEAHDRFNTCPLDYFKSPKLASKNCASPPFQKGYALLTKGKTWSIVESPTSKRARIARTSDQEALLQARIELAVRTLDHALQSRPGRRILRREARRKFGHSKSRARQAMITYVKLAVTKEFTPWEAGVEYERRHQKQKYAPQPHPHADL